ncbi:hypothetical protein DKP91_14835 [Enterococcus faecium]|uniref:Uncharacterized protein n=1 Tax=Enterococcus faecium TaxID=1352 RepID=A0AB73TLQ3_ENTFC|nr:predicted protein [Enterococcus faecium 1,231,408]PZM52880.1 hypothetical protein DKP91_14835 [Enterococcus faecium]
MISWILVLIYNMSKKILLRSFKLAYGCSIYKNIHKPICRVNNPSERYLGEKTSNTIYFIKKRGVKRNVQEKFKGMG